ncbi:MAG: zf-HC2 domain-containing protein [Terracidiphilus sp.]|jgi:anti-sigma factor RsiW
MSPDHLTSENITALIDGELPPEGEETAKAHLKDCHACALEVLAAQQLKLATRQAAQRFVPSPETLARLQARAGQHPPKAASGVGWRFAVWGSLAAALLLGLLIVASWQYRQADALSAELLDQHLAVLSDTSAPQVLSSDRHTVKPWFQGKLPFSFNLPEPNLLPPDSALLGADLTYVKGRPAALLLFSIHKHRVSVFVSQGEALPVLLLSHVRSGFQMTHANAAGLEFVAVSDVNRSELEALMIVLTKAQ